MTRNRVMHSVKAFIATYRYRSRRAIEVLKGRAPGREAEIYPDDVLIVSYPKSGNTWVRFLIGNLLDQRERVTFANLEEKVPSIYFDQGTLQRTPRPRILKSHEYFDPRYKKVIYIVRDPRDVAISYHHFLVKVGLIEEGTPVEQTLPRFIAGKLDAFGSWGENVGSWLGARGDDPDFLLLRYEDMLEDPVRELQKVAPFLSLEVAEKQVARAVELSSADQMRSLEKEQTWQAIEKTRKDKAFVRSARAGGWHTEIPEAAVIEIERAWVHLMEMLDYTTTQVHEREK